MKINIRHPDNVSVPHLFLWGLGVVLVTDALGLWGGIILVILLSFIEIIILKYKIRHSLGCSKNTPYTNVGVHTK